MFSPAVKESIVSGVNSQKSSWKVMIFGVLLILLLEVIWSRVEYRMAQAEQEYRSAAPASEWMEVTDVHVSTALVGEDPWIIAMDREYRFEGNMRMDWEVSVFNKSGSFWTPLCSARGFDSSYSKFTTVPVPVGLLDWWMGIKDPDKQCTQWPFPAGQTCMFTSWWFTPEGYPKKTYQDQKRCWQTVEPPDYLK